MKVFYVMIRVLLVSYHTLQVMKKKRRFGSSSSHQQKRNQEEARQKEQKREGKNAHPFHASRRPRSRSDATR